MAFGNPITDGTSQLSGTYGSVLIFDLSNQRVKDVVQVQVYDSVDLVTDVQSAGTTLAEIMLLPFSSAAPNVAWAQIGYLVYVFVLLSKYGIDANTRIAFELKSHAARVTATSEKLPGPSNYNELAKALISRGLKEDGGSRPGFLLDEAVRKEKAALSL